MVLTDKARAVNASSGFVTFISERETMLALNMRCSADVENFVLSIPPEPSNIIYDDLRTPPLRQWLWALIGYGCVFGVFWLWGLAQSALDVLCELQVPALCTIPIAGFQALPAQRRI